MTDARRRVALVTAGAFAHLDEDLPLLSAALGAGGVEAVVVDWHDEGFDWGGTDLAVIRSTWDYTSQLDAFLDRLARIDGATALRNPLPVVRANADKRYLRALAGAGVPVVPTDVVEPGDALRLPEDRPFVLKPAVSAGGRDTERYAPGDEAAAAAHGADLLAAGRAVLVQPYVEGVDDAGETGMVFVGDAFSHAFRKGPILRPDSGFVEGLYREEDITPRTATAEERAAAEAVLDAVGVVAPGWSRRDLLYARVDLVPGPDGPMLMELELIEPSLFLHVDDGAAARAAAAIAAHLGVV
jgi:glutathione synthase/RimK-type ligase-like ATP-grasp enzyme